MMHLAWVYKQLPERHGVLVVYRNGVPALDTGGAEPVFVRVMARRAHNLWGSEVELPRPGEAGVVAELDGGYGVWMGSIHWQDWNQVDPEPHQALRRLDNGFLFRARDNGDVELLHPSGLRLTISEDGAALPKPQRTGPLPDHTKPTPTVTIKHPTVGTLTLTKDGALTLEHDSGGVISVDVDGNLKAHDFASIGFQTEDAQFCMKALYDWVKTHTHSGVQSGGGVSGTPSSQPPASSLSPTTFKGPVDS